MYSCKVTAIVKKKPVAGLPKALPKHEILGRVKSFSLIQIRDESKPASAQKSQLSID